jgi:hypothetical protein
MKLEVVVVPVTDVDQAELLTSGAKVSEVFPCK